MVATAVNQERSERRRALRRRRRTRRTAAAVAVAIGAVVGQQVVRTAGEVKPGIRVAGIDLGGRSQDEARALVAARMEELLRERVTVEIGGRSAAVMPAALGIAVDLDATVDRAYEAERLRRSLLPIPSATDVAPVLRVPARVRLPQTIAALERPPRDARPRVRGRAVGLVTSRNGVTVPHETLARAVAAALIDGRPAVAVETVATPPAISNAVAKKAIAEARRLVDGPVSVGLRRRGVGRVSARELVEALRFRRVGDSWRVSFAPAVIASALRDDVKAIVRPPVNARLRTVGRRVRIVPDRPGLRLDARRTTAAVLAAAAGDRRARLAFARQPAEVSKGDLATLGIVERVASVTTDLGDSSANRIHNVALLASMLDGVVIRPKESFSFNDTVGPRTAARGFREGSAIVGGLLLPSIGGGVCQAATTLYDAAFYGGYPITQRRNHDFYISHYALGMDATVADGGFDLEFTNDTRYGILVRAWSDSSTMTVELYSTSRKLTVEKLVSAPYAHTAAPRRYIRNPNLAGRTVEQITSGQRGFDVDVTRVITRNGVETSRQTFSSHYTPQPIVYAVGPAFKAPKGAVIEDAPAGLFD